MFIELFLCLSGSLRLKSYCLSCLPFAIFSRASRMLRGATQPVRMPCVSVCGNFFPTNSYLQAGLTDLDEILHDGRS